MKKSNFFHTSPEVSSQHRINKTFGTLKDIKTINPLPRNDAKHPSRCLLRRSTQDQASALGAATTTPPRDTLKHLRRHLHTDPPQLITPRAPGFYLDQHKPVPPDHKSSCIWTSTEVQEAQCPALQATKATTQRSIQPPRADEHTAKRATIEQWCPTQGTAAPLVLTPT